MSSPTRRGLSFGKFTPLRKLSKGIRRSARSAALRADRWGFEQLESRVVLSTNPVLTVPGGLTVDENALLSVSNIGAFTDVAEFEGVFAGLNPLDYTSLGAFDPPQDAPMDPMNLLSALVPSVVINTDTMTISGGFSGTGVVQAANVGFGSFEIAVFTFSDFQLDAGATIVATGSRPLALLSRGNLEISGTIDVSAKFGPSNFAAGTPGPGGGAGGGVNNTAHGNPAAGAPTLGGGQRGSGAFAPSGPGGGFGGQGGRGQDQGQPNGQGGIAYADLQTAIQGGSGGAQGISGNSNVVYGGGGGGGIELGAVDTVTITSSGSVLANGAEGSSVFQAGFVSAAGGGAGGGILVHGTNVTQNGTLSAVGGMGGSPQGGGGGGGEIMLVHSAIGTLVHGGTENVSGGAKAVASGAAEAGQGGNVTVIAESPVNYSINWGDGSTPNSGPTVIHTPELLEGGSVAGSFDGSHIYADNGVYTVTVTVSDVGGDSDVETFTVTVNNVNPVLTLGKSLVTANVGQSVHNSGTFADVPADTVALSASVGTVVQDAKGVWQWTYQAAVGDPPAQAVTITATDEDGGSATVTFNVAGDSPDPVLAVVGSQTVNEGVVLNVTDLGTFTDVGQSAGESTGLDAADYKALGAFDPAQDSAVGVPSVLIDTDTLTISGGFSGRGSIELADIGFGVFEIAVFAFTDFQLDYGATIRAKGSRPLALLSLGGMVVAGTIDVSAYNGDLNQWNQERIAGPGGGNGGLGSNVISARQNGSPAAGAPADSVGTPATQSTGGGAGGGFGGKGGRAEGHNFGSAPSPSGTAGLAYGNLATAIQGGSGGATARSGTSNGGGSLFGGGGGGGGIELGAAGTLTVAATGEVLANGGKGTNGFDSVSGMGGGGGGAGGGILLHGASVSQFGTLNAKGGDAGFGNRNGGGGGGGRILVVHSSTGTFNNTGGIQDVLGGQQQFTSDVAQVGETGQVGIMSETPTSTPVVETFNYTINWGDGSPSDAGAATIDKPAATNGGVVEGSFDGNHEYADDGVYTVTVTVNDSGGGSDTRTFTVTVANVNPSITAAGPSVTVNEGTIASMTGAWSDVPADQVELTATIGTVTENADGTWDWSYDAADDLLTQTVTITATDDDLGESSVTFDLTVNNVAPEITAAAGSVTVNEGSLASITGAWSDVPLDEVTLAASFGTVTKNPDGTWDWSYDAADDLLTQTVTITATDDDNGESNVTFDLTVNNLAPAIVLLGDVNVNEASLYELSFSSTDPGDDTITGWTIDWGDGQVDAVSAATTTLTHTYVDGDAGSIYNIIVTATDEDGSFDSSPLEVTVLNVAPTASAGGPYFTFDDWSIALNGGGSDVAGVEDPLTYAWDLNNDGTYEVVGEDPVLNPAALGAGVHTLKLKVSDNDGGEAFSQTTVTVLSEGTLLIDGVLHVVGNNGGGDLVLISQCGEEIKVLATFIDDNPAVYAAGAVGAINVRTRSGHDVVVTTSNVVKTMTIDGGAGNDLLVGGGGENRIYGGAGHDTLYGGFDDDMLFGGDGDDDLFGGSGMDVLVGGAGRDILDGGSDRDLLIGGLNEDRLHGGTDDDILIGGFTCHDADLAKLDAIMAIWGSEDSFSARVAALTSPGGLLVAGETVFDDNAADHIIGAAGRDLAFADTTKNWDDVRDTISLSSSQDTLIALN